jgi:hypothetical protein
VGTLLLWFGVLGGVGTWMLHLVLVASMVQYVCNHGGFRWVMDVATAATALATVACIWISVSIMRAADDDEAAGTRAGIYQFLGVFGVLTGATSLGLILLEGSYVWFLDPCD